MVPRIQTLDKAASIFTRKNSTAGAGLDARRANQQGQQVPGTQWIQAAPNPAVEVYNDHNKRSDVVRTMSGSFLKPIHQALCVTPEIMILVSTFKISIGESLL